MVVANHELNPARMNSSRGERHEYRLFYKQHCPPCRVLSRFVVILSLGAIRRIPLDSEEAEALGHEHPEWRGQLMLLHRERIWFAQEVFRAVPSAIAKIYLRGLCCLVFLRRLENGDTHK